LKNKKISLGPLLWHQSLSNR